MAKDKPRICWDTDALIRGIHSPGGPASTLLQATAAGRIESVLNAYAFGQAERLLTFTRGCVGRPWEPVGKVGTPTHFLGKPVTDFRSRSRGNR